MSAQCLTAWTLPGTVNCSCIHSLRVKLRISPQRYKAGTEARCRGNGRVQVIIFFSWKTMKGMKGACRLIVTLNVPHLDMMWMSLPSYQMVI